MCSARIEIFRKCGGTNPAKFSALLSGLSSAKMPAAIPWGEDELQALVSNPQSRVFLDQKKVSVALQPFHLQDLKSAVRDLLNASVDSYDKSLDGILLSFKHLKVLSKSASVTAETSAVILDIQADFYVFRPEIGCILKGVVNKISKDHVGVLLYHRFNITCPRPSSAAKSKKWIGSNVVMRQEVIFKLKEKSFTGTLPFFSGKIMDIGTVITDTVKGEEKKSKKKAKDVTLEKSNASEIPDTSSIVSKKRKIKPEESDQTLEVKTKKSKKDDISRENVKKSIGDEGVATVSTDSSISKKKKKKASIGSVDESDFIPRFSLDASPLPEHLPPPNADSTHFDFTKNLSGIISKSEKKKKGSNAGLSLITEESSEGLKGASTLNAKTELVSEVKNKKKHKAELAQDQFNKKTQESSFNNEFCNDSRLKTLPEPAKKKKQIVTESVGMGVDTNLKAKKTVPSSSATLQSTHSVSPKKKHKAEGSSSEIEETVPKKGKKGNVSFQLDRVEANTVTKARNPSEDTPTKSKKKSREDLSNTTPSKVPKIKKEKLVAVDVASDDVIPPGQKSFQESPKKHQLVNSPLKERSLTSVSITKSPGIGYFAASSSVMDLDLNSSRKGMRQTPLMFGNLEGKILPPPESPMKSPPSKKVINYDSDSDTPAPKKVVISSSVRPESSDSSDSETSQRQPALKEKANPSMREKKDGSDESDSDASVKRLLQSMGVMQSPLKPTMLSTKHDTSESESEGSSDVESKNIVSNQRKPPIANKFSNVNNSNQKLSKPILAAKTTTKTELTQRAASPKKSAKINVNNKNASKGGKLSPSKGKDGSHSSIRPEPEESDTDSDLEMMKAAMLKMEEERLTAWTSKTIPKSKAKSSKPNSESNQKKAQVVSEKKPSDKLSRNMTKVTSKYSRDAVSDSDVSDSELMKAAMAKLKGEQQDISSKPSDESKTKRGKTKTSDKAAVNSSKVTSKDSKNLGGISNNAHSSEKDLSTTDLIKAVMSRFNEEQLAGVTSKTKSKSKSKEKKSSDVVSMKNLSSISNDSDSGPDDKNTTGSMEEMRLKRGGGDLLKKLKKGGKQLKSEEAKSGALETSSNFKGAAKEKIVESINGSKSKKKKEPKIQKSVESIQKAEEVGTKKVEAKKSKSSKVNVSGKSSAGQDSVIDKKATKGKKKGSTDDEISDVMQRLLRQAQMSVGLA